MYLHVMPPWLKVRLTPKLALQLHTTCVHNLAVASCELPHGTSLRADRQTDRNASECVVRPVTTYRTSTCHCKPFYLPATPSSRLISSHLSSAHSLIASAISLAMRVARPSPLCTFLHFTPPAATTHARSAISISHRNSCRRLVQDARMPGLSLMRSTTTTHTDSARRRRL